MALCLMLVRKNDVRLTTFQENVVQLDDDLRELKKEFSSI